MRVLAGLVALFLVAALAAATAVAEERDEPNGADPDEPNGADRDEPNTDEGGGPTAEERDGPLPRVERVGPTTPPPAAGSLQLTPAVTEVVVPADRRVEVRHVVANGLEVALDLDVEVLAGEVDAEGPTLGQHDTGGPTADQHDTGNPTTDRHDTGDPTTDRHDTGDPTAPTDPVRLAPPVERVRLRPGEGAALISTAQADAGEAALLALTATAPDGTRAAAWVVVAADDTAADPQLDLLLEADGQARLTASTVRPAVLDVRLRTRSWVGATSDDTVAEVVVGTQPRRLPLSAPASRLPGPVAAAAVARTGTGEETVARADRVVLPPLAWLAVALVLLAVVAVAARRHRRGHAWSPSGP